MVDLRDFDSSTMSTVPKHESIASGLLLLYLCLVLYKNILGYLKEVC